MLTQHPSPFLFPDPFMSLFNKDRYSSLFKYKNMLLNNSICDSVTACQDSPCFNQSYQLSEQSCHTHLITFCTYLTAMETCRATLRLPILHRGKGVMPRDKAAWPRSLWTSSIYIPGPTCSLPPCSSRPFGWCLFSTYMAWTVQLVLGHE